MRHKQSKFRRNRTIRKGCLHLTPKLFFVPILPAIGVGRIKMILPPHAPKPVQDCSKAGNNKGHFTLHADIVFRPYLASHCSRVTLISQVGLSRHSAQTVQDWSKSCSGALHLKPKQFFVPVSPTIAAE
jgi:hypothetical protein